MGKKRVAVFLNGAVNSGKSTVAAMLAKNDDNGCYIEGDECVGLESTITYDIWLERTTVEMGDAAVRMCLAGLRPYVAFPLRDKDWTYLQARCERAGVTAICITLAPTLETLLSKRGKRSLNSDESTRAEAMIKDGYGNRSFSALTIDNSNENAAATTKRIGEFLET